MTKLINNYDEQQRLANEQLVESSISALPYTLAHHLERLYENVAQEDYSKAKDYILEWFELATQYLSVIIFALLRENIDKVLSANTLNTIADVVGRIDIKRPLSFGDWCNDILPPLTNALVKTMPESPLAKALEKRTTSKNNLFIGSKNEKSIVSYRNKYKGHGMMLSDEIYFKILSELEPRLLSLLEALEPIRNSNIITLEGHVWLEGDLSKQKLDLFPMLYADENDYVFLFQSLNDEKAYYVSANERAESQLTTDNNPAIDAFFQTFVPAFDIAKRRNWTEWTALLHASTGRFLQGVYREKKYNRELFVERDSLTAMLRDFDASPATLFPLPGEAGQGKTNQLCYWSEQISSGFEGIVPHKASVLIFAGASMTGTTLETFLKNALDISPRKDITKVLAELHDAAESADAELIIFIDALNECDDPVTFFNDIVRLLVQPQYPRFKTLFTCRNYTWKQLLQPRLKEVSEGLLYTGEQSENNVVRGFNDKELEHAYAIYSDVYSVQTPFQKLSRSLAIRLKDPLVLKITCTNYLGTHLPKNTRNLTSVVLWKQLYDNIRFAYAGSKQLGIIDEMIKAILQSYKDGKPQNFISISELHDAFDDKNHTLHNLASQIFLKKQNTDDSKKLSITVAFAELINRPERPILRYDDEKIQFVYERFLEYVLAVSIRKMLPEKPDAESVKSLLENVPADEVFLGAMRNVLILNYLESKNSELFLKLIANHSDNFLIMTLVTDVMNVLVRENYEDEVFQIERDLINANVLPNATAVFNEFNGLAKTIGANKADNNVIARFNELHEQLQPVLHLRNLAIQSLLGGIFLTDYFNENLYHSDPFDLLWMLTDDPLVEVKDAVCLQSYYISYQHYTFGGTHIERNLSELIASRMYDWLDSHSVVLTVSHGRLRSRMMTFLETATRLLVLLIIDVMLAQKPDEQYRIKQMLDRLRKTVKHLTLNHSLIRMVLPAVNIVMRRQLTVQSDYVNNAIEYQHLWDEIPVNADTPDGWGRADLPEIMKHIYQYSRYYSKGKIDEAPDFRKFTDKILSAYRTGDSTSYFVLERLLVINGICSWDSIEPLLKKLDSDEMKLTKWWDYSQMSLIYVLYQLGLKMDNVPDMVYEMLGRWCVDWTRRLRGYFVAPNSHRANSQQKYKRNVMTWYAMVCAHRDGDIRREAYKTAPLFYQLIDEAVDNNDGELLSHLMDNISELIADSGYINIALDLLSHVMRRIDSEDKLVKLNLLQTMPQQIALLLSTAKSYAPNEVNSFLTNEILQLPFPGVENYRDEILNYTPCGEKLADVLTHRFGNFVIFALIHEEDVETFCYNVAQHLSTTKDFSEWFAIVVRMLIRDMLKIKIKV